MTRQSKMKKYIKQEEKEYRKRYRDSKTLTEIIPHIRFINRKTLNKGQKQKPRNTNLPKVGEGQEKSE